MKINLVTKVSDVRGLLKQTIDNPQESFPALRQLAGSNDWKNVELSR